MKEGRRQPPPDSGATEDEVATLAFSAQVFPIESAAVWLASTLASLVREMKSFQAVPEARYEPSPPQVWSQNLTDEDVEHFEREIHQEGPDCSPEAQFRDRFADRLDALEVMVLLTTHALCEATANATVEIAKSSPFRVSPPKSRLSFVQKWVKGPRSIVQNYGLPKHLVSKLWQLQKARNQVAHSAIEVWEGSDPCEECTGDCDGGDTALTILRLARALRLAYELLENLCSQVENPDLKFLLQIQLQSRAELERTLVPVDQALRESRSAWRAYHRRAQEISQILTLFSVFLRLYM